MCLVLLLLEFMIQTCLFQDSGNFPSLFLLQVVSGSKTEKYYQGLLIELFATDGIKLE